MNSQRRYHLGLLWGDEHDVWITCSLPEAIKHMLEAFGYENKPNIVMYPETFAPEKVYRIQEYAWQDGELKKI